MAETYLAIRRGPGDFVQHVCLKRIRPDLEQDPEFVRQFMTEAAIAARLRHTAITQVLDFGRDGNDYYLALELVDGLDLRQLLDAGSGCLSAELTWYVAVEIATALDFAHRASGSAEEAAVVHRDVSASNVLISVEGEVKLTDFGIARSLGGQRHTRTGIVKGKVPYMAPEYARTGRFDPRCDLFGLGVLLYECLCGERPHDGATELETLELASQGSHVALEQRVPAVSQAFARIVEQLLAPDPELRFQSAAGLLEALLALPSPQRARRSLGALVADKKRARSTPAAAHAFSGLEPTQPLSESLSRFPSPATPPTRTRLRREPDPAAEIESTEIPGLAPRRGAKLALSVAVTFAFAVLVLGMLRASDRLTPDRLTSGAVGGRTDNSHGKPTGTPNRATSTAADAHPSEPISPARLPAEHPSGRSERAHV